LYNKHTEVPASLHNTPLPISKIKECIKRLAVSLDHNHSASNKRVGFATFFYNSRMGLKGGKIKYKFRYPFVYFLNNTTIPRSECPTKKKTDYPLIVERIISKLEHTGTDKEYNRVVRQVDKAINIVKSISNGNFAENRRRLPDLLYETMLNKNIECNTKELGLAVYNLESEMKRRCFV
jgi:hypothetical protein